MNTTPPLPKKFANWNIIFLKVVDKLVRKIITKNARLNKML